MGEMVGKLFLHVFTWCWGQKSESVIAWRLWKCHWEKSLKLGVLWRSVSKEISVKERSRQGVEPARERVAGIPDFHCCWYYGDFWFELNAVCVKIQWRDQWFSAVQMLQIFTNRQFSDILSSFLWLAWGFLSTHIFFPVESSISWDFEV